ncbi:hypothetical protein [Hymenobacter lucidus]|uniref:Uncharacterized protein n=1 Tax=Hymenobacter lucidus TaxID=2880930 RepID=A0ABS8AR86_9BACT|nr:hypothetical protein [Hymenobacter lucidus]MCB2408732.1 hypothetical protein [Hymenobacter lucidus]
MKFSPRSVLYAALLTLPVLGSLSSCETSKRGFPEVSSPSNDPDEANRRKLEATSTQLARLNEGKVEYIMPRAQLATAFIREFNDGTVVDKTMIRKVQESAKDKPVYYLVGLGLRDGMFRSMAIPLITSTDQSLYLSSNSERYTITSVGCSFCYFSFEKNQITGTTCGDDSGGSRCDMVVGPSNTLFRRR